MKRGKLDRSAHSHKEVIEQHNQGYHQQDVDKRPEMGHKKAEKPKDDKDDNDRPEDAT
jgi:hypothetical protein